MAKSKQKKVAKRQEAQQPTPPMQDEDESEEEEAESEVDIIVDGELEKDETEEELERLVFGDSLGFREGLRDVHMEDAEDGDEDEDATGGMEGLDDAQVGGIAL